MGSLLQNIADRADRRLTRDLRRLAASLLPLLIAWPASGLASIVDNASVFSPAVETRVRSRAQALRREFATGLVVESHASAPGLSAETAANQQASPAFAEWVKKRVQRAGKDNVFVLVVKSPAYLLVSVGETVRARDIFTRNDRDILMNLLAERFRTGGFDKGVLEATAFVENTLTNRINGTDIPTLTTLVAERRAAAMKQQAENRPASFLQWIGLILIGVFGTWLGINIYQTVVAVKRKTATEAAP